MTIALPLFHILIIFNNYSNLDSEDFKQKYSTLVEDINKKSLFGTIYIFIFLMRRLLFALAAVFLINYPMI